MDREKKENAKIFQRKQTIKSRTTVYNRGRPKNARTLQAKKHKGKWLFSSKKTKSKEKNIIHTKHQRAHVKHAVIHLCKEDQDLALIHSMDDKAYLKPEASAGYCLTCSDKFHKKGKLLLHTRQQVNSKEIPSIKGKRMVEYNIWLMFTLVSQFHDRIKEVLQKCDKITSEIYPIFGGKGRVGRTEIGMRRKKTGHNPKCLILENVCDSVEERYWAMYDSIHECWRQGECQDESERDSDESDSNREVSDHMEDVSESGEEVVQEYVSHV
ncbi:unnamed protein product [Mytilus edulis]|uniref:Uncharacterized protein n=1 Tax=Mytilus edulis TaxID=6550 RepID=A0A8S3SD60_MYTED|nr:unnamed protein product [Mytilus edulis]